MKIRFTEEAAEAVFPPCFNGDHKAALEGIGPVIVARAGSRGNSYVQAGINRIDLKVTITAAETWISLPSPPCREECVRCGETFDCEQVEHFYEDEPLCPICRRDR